MIYNLIPFKSNHENGRKVYTTLCPKEGKDQNGEIVRVGSNICTNHCPYFAAGKPDKILCMAD